MKKSKFKELKQQLADLDAIITEAAEALYKGRQAVETTRQELSALQSKPFNKRVK